MENEYVRRAGMSVIAVIQPIVFSWVIAVILAVFCFTITASAPVLSEVHWQDAARVGTSIWILAFGGPLSIAGSTIGLMPLCVTALLIWFIHRSMRRYMVTGWVAIVAGALAAFAVTSLIGMLALPGSIQWLGGLGAAVIVVFCGLLTFERPAWLRQGWRIAWPALAALAILAAVLLVVGLVTGWSRVQEIQNYYLLNGFSTVIFALAQLLYLPNVLIWALAYVSGIGFAIGEGTAFSPFGIESAPLPAVPILGTLPDPNVSMPWIIAVPIVLGIAVGLWRSAPAPKDIALHGLPAFGIILIAAALAGALASGGIGTGRMSTVGINPPLFAIALAGEVGGGLLIGLGVPHLIEKIRASRRSDDTLPE